MIKKHRILWAEALCVGVVCVLHPRVLGWVDYFVPYLTLAFLVLLAMYEESRSANKEVPKVGYALTSLAFILVYVARFFPSLDGIVPTRFGTEGINLLVFLGFMSGFIGVLGWKAHIDGEVDDGTNWK
jgi:hypothetical protein